MTEDEADKIFDLKEQLWDLVHDVVSHHLEGEDINIDQEVRQQMTEDFRFWSRL